MKITRRQLRRIIREAINETTNWGSWAKSRDLRTQVDNDGQTIIKVDLARWLPREVEKMLADAEAEGASIVDRYDTGHRIIMTGEHQ